MRPTPSSVRRPAGSDALAHPDAHTQAVEAAREIVLRRLDRSAAPRAALAELLERKEVDPPCSLRGPRPPGGRRSH